MKSIFIFVIIFFCALTLTTDTVQAGLLFNRFYYGSWDKLEYGRHLQQTSDGGYAVITNGYYIDYMGNMQRVLMLMKTNSNGSLSWSKSISIYGYHAEAQTVRQTADNGYICACRAVEYFSSEMRPYLLKFDFEGNSTSSATMTEKIYTYAFNCVQTTPDDGYIISSTVDVNSHYDAYLTKTNSLMSQTWTMTFGKTTRNEGAYWVEKTLDGGYILVGTTDVDMTSDANALLIRTDSAGNEIWTTEIGSSDPEMLNCVSANTDGTFTAAGYRLTEDANEVYYVIKLDSDGDEIWSETFGGSDTDIAYSVVQAWDGGYAVGGFSKSTENPAGDSYIVKLDPNGNLIWDFNYRNSYEQSTYFVIENADHALIGTGYDKEYQNGEVWLYGFVEESIVNLNDPNGGEQLLKSEKTMIEWDSEGPLDQIYIYYSTSGSSGAWIAVTPQNVGNTGSYEWTIPSADSDTCYVMIQDPVFFYGDVSDAAFSIYTCPLATDLTGDCIIDFKDIAALASQWLQCQRRDGLCPPD